MASETETKAAGESAVPLPLLIVIAVVVAGATGFYYYLKYSRSGPPQAVLTAEAKSYVKHLQLSGVEMKATESYIGQAIVEIIGRITNNGDRTLSQVDINCVFYDPYGQVVLRQRVSIVRPKTGGLKPGETKDFRLPFDELPQSWNNSMPQLVIAQIIF